jgi:hypothetical protein
MKPVTVPSGEPLVDVSLPSVEQCAGALKTLARLRDEAAAMVVEHQGVPINLVAADIWFQDPELAGLAVVRVLQVGDCALIDTRDTHVDAGIFAVLYVKSVTIMQLERVHESGHPTDRVRRLWPNPLYGRQPNSDQYTLGEDLEIIGRVVQKVTRFL